MTSTRSSMSNTCPTRRRRGRCRAAGSADGHRSTRPRRRWVLARPPPTARCSPIAPGQAKDRTRLLELVSHLVQGVDLPTLARALESNVLSEIDYEHEADNIEEFARNFKDEAQIEIPGLHRELSRGRVLVMDWVE